METFEKTTQPITMTDTVLNVIIITLAVITLTFFMQTFFIFRPKFPQAYMAVCSTTKSLEDERETNQGKHYDDESVYLNKAQSIRENSRFFDLVNGVGSNE